LEVGKGSILKYAIDEEGVYEKKKKKTRDKNGANEWKKVMRCGKFGTIVNKGSGKLGDEWKKKYIYIFVKTK
jgi:isopentenyl phosphate kinase